MAMRLPPLSTLRLFEAAGRLQSFKAAAEELYITPGAVSHGILKLERWLGAELFERGPKGVVLTAAGQEYLSFISEALSVIAVGTRRLPRYDSQTRVAVSAAPTFASRWLVPRLAAFREQHPEVSLTIDTSHRQVGLPADDVDLAIRMGRAPWAGLESTCLFVEKLVPVCSPAFFERRAQNGRIDLRQVPLLHVTSVTEDWVAWLDSVGIPDVDISNGHRFDEIHMAIAAAQAGLGVAIGRAPLIKPDLRAGRLITAGYPEVKATTSYWLVHVARGEMRPSVQAFWDWLIDTSRNEST